jgi:hypothetical protein
MADLPPPDSSNLAATQSSTLSHVSSPFPQPTVTRFPSSSSTPSNDDLHAPDAVAALAGVQGSDSDMEPSSSGHRRRRSSLMNSLDASAHSKTKRPHRSPGGGSRIQEESKLGDGGDEELSTSDDVELSALSEDEGLQDDEETGLTGKDKKRRKGKRRRHALLDQRIAGEVRVTAEETREANQSVVKRSFINVLLIGLWYLFSLSISIVSPFPSRSRFNQVLTSRSTTNGCSIPSTSISTSRSSQLAFICWCSSPSHHWSSFSFHGSVHDTTQYPIQIMHTRMRTMSNMKRIPRSL